MDKFFKSVVDNRYAVQKEILPNLGDLSQSEQRLSKQMDRNQEKREREKKDKPELSDFIDNGTLILSNFGR
jgi:hypothetical protein